MSVRPATTGNGETGIAVGTPGHTGSVANLPTLNSQRLVPGVTLKNNVIAHGGQSGIVFSGSPIGDIAYAVPFGRIVNNTIVQTPFGIQVVNNASPTILNNIIAENKTGLFIDDTSGTTIVGANVYQNNHFPNSNTVNNLVAPVSVFETNSIALAAGAPLFVDSSKGNFYLKAGSLAIDSSVNSLQERARWRP